MTAEQVRENRLRRMAERQGLQLVKSRRRDPRALGFGTFTIVDTATNALRAGGAGAEGLTVDEVERHLLDGPGPA